MHDAYRDPLFYDLEYEDMVEDIAWYTALGRAAAGPVVELGCGTGRVTLPLARAAVRVTGVDLSLPMLDRLAGRLAAEAPDVRDRVTLRQGDFRDPHGADQALVILPFNAVHHCATASDVLRLLAAVRQSLRPGGKFAFDCYFPAPDLYSRDPNERYGERTFIHPVTGAEIESWEQSRYDALEQVHHVHYVYVLPGGRQHRVHLRLRMYYPQEMRLLLELGGFEIVEEWADFARRPLTATARKWVLVLRPR